MITIYLNYAIIKTMATGSYGGAEILVFAVMIWWDIIVFGSFAKAFGSHGNYRPPKDYNEGYHSVDVDNNGKIDWYEL